MEWIYRDIDLGGNVVGTMGERMSVPRFETEMLPALLAGTARQPLPSWAGVPHGSQSGPHLLSLTGQALRFEPPAAPTHFNVEPVIEDHRWILPDTLRRPLLRLLNGKVNTEHPALAIARGMDQQRLRPHPFDLPKLDGFVRKHAEQLGTTAQSWASSKSEVDESVGFYDRDILDEANWTQSTLPRRVLFLEALRGDDAAKARELLEAAWPQETADARTRLLRALSNELSCADESFLESLQKDRSPRVRQLACRLLSRLGVETEYAALKEMLGRISRTQTGLLRTRPVLTLQLPATVKEPAAPQWIRENFSEVTLEALSRALQLSALDTIEAAAKDSNLLLALAVVTTMDKQLDDFAEIVEHLPNAWELLSMSGLDDLGAMTRSERERWAGILIRPYGYKLPTSYAAWSWLHVILQGPAPTSLLEAAFRSDWFNAEASIVKHTNYWMELTAAICPHSQRNQLRERLKAFDPALTATALPLLHVLDALENVANA